MARLKSSTVSPFTNVPSEGRHVVYDRLSHDWYGFFDGHFVKAGRRDEVEEAVMPARTTSRGSQAGPVDTGKH